MNAGTWRRLARLTLKALASIALLALALRGVDLVAVRGQLAAAHPWTVVAAIALTIAIAVAHAQRWRIVLGCLGRGMRFACALRLVLIGYFFNQTLPSTVGGDAYRIWGAYRQGIRAGDAIASVVIDRLLALASLLLMIGLGMRWLFELIPAPSARWIVILVVAGGGIGLAVLPAIGRLAPIFQRWRLTRHVIPFAMAARTVLAHRRATIAIVALTFVGYGVASYVVHMLARGLSVDLGVGDALLLFPLVTLVSVLPVSIAGWGLRESAMVVALGLIGIPAAAAFSVSVLYGLVVLASGAPGGVIWLLSRRVDPAIGNSAIPPHPQH